MKMYRDYGDSRHQSGCIFCSRDPNSRDHIPARVFLHKPYPQNLHVVPVCETCNNELSADEEYVSFLLYYLKLIEIGEGNEHLDSKVFSHFEAMEQRVLSGWKVDKSEPSVAVTIDIEAERIRSVLNKYGYAHFCYERGEHPNKDDAEVRFAFVDQLSDDQVKYFNGISDGEVYPEVGSRLFQRVVEDGDSWMTVQDGWYRYYVSPCEPYVRIAIHEILFAEVVFYEST